MSSNFDKFQKRRLISSYFSVVLSVFLVLFLLGVLGLFIINSKKLANDFKEKIAMTVFFKNEATDSVTKAFDTELKRARFAKSYVYVTKEKAAKEHTDIIGEDFLTFLGENPLLNSYDIHLKAEYVERDSIVKIESNLRKNTMIEDIVYDKQLVNLVNDNIRFIIKTMQMVGATKAFIRKPFVMRSIKLGMLGAALAIVALIALLFYVESNFPGLGIMEDKALIGLVLLAVFGLGVLITWVSTHFATQRFLNLRTDDLY